MDRNRLLLAVGLLCLMLSLVISQGRLRGLLMAVGGVLLLLSAFRRKPPTR